MHHPVAINTQLIGVRLRATNRVGTERRSDTRVVLEFLCCIFFSERGIDMIRAASFKEQHYTVQLHNNNVDLGF